MKMVKGIMDIEEMIRAVSAYETAINTKDYETALSINQRLYEDDFARYKIWREIRRGASSDNCRGLVTVIDSAIERLTKELDILFKTGLKLNDTTTKEEAK